MVEYPAGMDQAPRDPGPDEVKYVHTAAVYGRALAWTLALVLTLMLGLGVWQTILIRNGQVQNRSTLVNTASAAHDAQITSDAITSCVTPGMPCFERAQRSTASVVSNVQQIIIAAAACAVGKTGTPTQIEIAIQACVYDRLAAHPH